MIRYTTPTITLTVEGIDLTGKVIYATFEQGRRKLTKRNADMTVSTVTEDERTDTVLAMMLTQEETAAFDFDKSVLVQVNWISVGGIRCATEIKKIGVMRNLLDEVVSYGD